MKISVSDWVNFLIHKRKGLDEITNNIWKSYYADRAKSLAVITILSTAIFAFLSVAINLNIFSVNSPIMLLVAFLGGIDVVVIARYFILHKHVVKAMIKLGPFRYPLDEMLIKLIHGKYKNLNELKKEYNEKLGPLQTHLKDLSKPFFSYIKEMGLEYND
jgi:hypothetical protein